MSFFKKIQDLFALCAVNIIFDRFFIKEFEHFKLS